jgi:diguanylate cyclase (GGDEF)-like protein
MDMDALTAGISLILVQLCIAVIMTGVYFSATTEKTTRYWALSGNIAAVGVLLAVLNRSGQLPILLLCGTTSIIAGLTFQWQGIQLFYKRQPPSWGWLICIVYFTLHILLLLVFGIGVPRLAILFSGTTLILFGLSLHAIWQGQGRNANSFVQRLVRGAIILLVVSQVFKMAVSVLQLLGYLSGHRSSIEIFAAYQVPLVGMVLFSTGLLLLYFERTIEENQHLATHDELSKLFNRRAIVEVGQRELELSKRLQRSLTLAFIDIDFLKRFNDEFGHKAGDTVIHDISRIFEQTCRNIDVVGRYGGEEFLIVLPGANRDDAVQIGERLLAAVHTYRFRETHPVTISIGFATLSPDDEDCDWDQLLQRADAAMYRAKQDGRDRCYA